MSTNGEVSFTKERKTFELEGITFRTRAVDPREWAETLEAAARGEREVLDTGGVVIGISAEGTEQLILLAIAEDDHEGWRKLRGDKAIDFGQLNDIRTWIWEQMTERPFSSLSESGTGPGSDEASSKDESPSPEAIEVH
jgi:hypothetical protein